MVIIRSVVGLLLLAMFGALAACATPPSQPGATLAYLPTLKGEYFPFASKATGRTYHIYVRVPQAYNPSAATRYPVVYLLDADSLFPILAGQQLLVAREDKLPEVVIVGIAYGSFDPSVNKRDVDFVPPGGANGGGAPAFSQFLRTELLPHIEERFAVDPARRILFGQSLGGTYTLYSAFTDPDLFWGRIVSNPSFRAGREIFFGSPAAGTRPGLGLIVASGTADNPAGRADALAWFSAWRGRKGPWSVHPVTIEGGTHGANTPDAYRAGLRLLFRTAGAE